MNQPAMVSDKVTKQSEQSEEIAEEAVAKQRSCVHFDKCVDLDKLLKVIKSCQEIKCGECKQGVRVKEKKILSFLDSPKKAIWVCLECGYYSCGDAGLPTGGNSHVVKHMRMTRHRLVMQCERPKLRWCFSCQSLVPFDKEENGVKKDLLLEVVKAIKERCPRSGSSRSICGEIKTLEGSSVSRARDGYYDVRGLVNLGNTCFFNSVLQNLLSLDQLRDHLLKDDDLYGGGPLVSSLKRLFEETESEVGSMFKSVINPRDFFGSVCCKAPQFKGFQQHDSHELLRCLLDGLSMEESSLRKKLDGDGDDNDDDTSSPPTLIDSIFGGEISSTVSCLECGHSSKVYEPFLDLSLPLPSKKQTLSPVKVLKNPETETETNMEVDSCWLDLFGTATSSTKTEGGDQSFKGSRRETLMHDNDARETDARAMQSKKDIAVSWIDEARFLGYPDKWYDEARVLGFPDPWYDDDEELPLLVADSQALCMPCKDNISNDDKAVAESKGEALSSSVSGGNEQNVVDYVDFSDFFDEPEVSEEPSKAGCEAPSSFLSGKHEQNIDDEAIGSLFDDDEDYSDHEVVVLDDSDSPVSVDRCLAQFTKTEVLSEDNAWHCENCCNNLKLQLLREGIKAKEHGDSLASDAIMGDLDTKQPPITSSATESDKKEDETIVSVKRAASKRVLVNKAPPVLTIHLKRFSQNARGRLSKLSGHVDFKEFIDLGQYMDSRLTEEDKPLYRLSGVVVHSGIMGTGHYVAYVRGGHKDSSVWYHASDSYVRRVSFEEVLSSEAYLLFYRRI
ncbi:unnamed protein product [Microthlaspi erraticum]|uniref:Ubiquitin carboxyl-terminal hydrolase n=1 Tax=Microthlaspi erraticum TaxID=1685480 RepID=A0A6D2K5L4_9BRAS|nr:unnamed protein product [Microthlaspi erraticum]